MPFSGVNLELNLFSNFVTSKATYIEVPIPNMSQLVEGIGGSHTSFNLKKKHDIIPRQLDKM